jgi:hypothetical protein
MAEKDDPAIFGCDFSNNVEGFVAAGIIDHNDLIYEGRHGSQGLPNEFFFIICRNYDSDGLFSVHVPLLQQRALAGVKG